MMSKDIIADFIVSELNDKSVRSTLFSLIELENLLLFEYEGNQYNILFNREKCNVILIDTVSEEHGVETEWTRANMNLNDFIRILI